MNAFRIGFVGFTGETLVVVARSNPSDEMLANYAPLMRQYRSTLVDDLVRADLPQDFMDALGRIDQDAQSVKQLQSVINACLTVKDLVARLPHDQPAKATKRDNGARPMHMHPKGFTFEYPVGWTLEDDSTNKTMLLLPPGVTLNSPGAKAVFLVDATPLQSDPFAMRAYFERQLAPARSVNYSQEALKSDVGPGGLELGNGNPRAPILGPAFARSLSSCEKTGRSTSMRLGPWQLLRFMMRPCEGLPQAFYGSDRQRVLDRCRIV